MRRIALACLLLVTLTAAAVAQTPQLELIETIDGGIVVRRGSSDGLALLDGGWSVLHVCACPVGLGD